MARSTKTASSLQDVAPFPPATADEFPWVSSRNLRFTSKGEFVLAFPPECPVMLHFFQFTADHHLTSSYHDYFELTLVCEGQGRFLLENRPYAVGEGDLLLVGGREFHLMEVEPGGMLKTAAVHFKPELVHSPGGSALDYEYLRPFYYRTSDFSPRVGRRELPENLVLDRMARMRREIQVGGEGYQLAIKTYLTDILLEVGRHYRRDRGELIPQNQRIRDFERLREVFSYMVKNCQEPISLAHVARMAHMSPNYFCRFFKYVTGNTFTEYALRLRVDLAMEFLTNSAMSVTEIAYASGFSSHSYFDRVFKQLKGVTPLEYRRQLKFVVFPGKSSARTG